jgi:hypothetical protein
MIAELPAAREPSDSISIFPFIPQKNILYVYLSSKLLLLIEQAIEIPQVAANSKRREELAETADRALHFRGQDQSDNRGITGIVRTVHSQLHVGANSRALPPHRAGGHSKSATAL